MRNIIKQILEDHKKQINKKNTFKSDNCYLNKIVLGFLWKIADRKNYNGELTESKFLSNDYEGKVLRFLSEKKIAFWIQQRTMLPLRNIQHTLLRLKLQGYWMYNKELMTVELLKPMSEMMLSQRFLYTEIPDYLCKQFILKTGRKITWTILHQMIYDDIDSFENKIKFPIIPVNELGQMTESTFYKSLMTMSRENFVELAKLNKIIKDIDCIFHGRRFCTKEELDKRVYYTSRSKRTSVVARRNLHEYILKFQEEECVEVNILRLKKIKVETEEGVKVEFKKAKERKYTVDKEKKERNDEEFLNAKKELKEKQKTVAEKFKKLCRDLNYKCSCRIPDRIKNNTYLISMFVEKAEEELEKIQKTLSELKESLKKKAIYWQYCKYKIKEYLHIPYDIQETENDVSSINYIWNNLLLC